MLFSASFSFAEMSQHITEKYSNDVLCDKIENKIFLLDNVKIGAVAKKDNNVLCGILCDEYVSEEDLENMKNYIKDAVVFEFPKAEEIIVEINTQKARDIAELSYYSAKNMSKKQLLKRFDYLLKN